MANLSPETRTRILRAARGLFEKKAFDSVTMDEVAESCDIGRVTIFRYFSTKLELLMAVLGDIEAEFLVQLRAAEDAVLSRSSRDRLEALIATSVSCFMSRLRLVRLLDRAAGEQALGEFPWPNVQRELYGRLEALLAIGVTRGEFVVESIEVAVRAILGAVRFQLFFPCMETPQDKFPKRLLDVVTRPNAIASMKLAG